MCLKERRKKLFYKERMFLRTFWWNYKWIRMMSFHHSQLQLIHSCITTSRGLSQMARKKRMFFRTFFTWNNTFFATLVHQATKQEHMDCFFSYKPNSCMFMYISSELLNFSLYKYKHIARHFLRAYTQEFNSLLHVNIQRNIHKTLQQQQQSKLQISFISCI